MSLSELKLPFQAIDLVPHRNRMLLIESLNDFTKETAKGVLRVKRDSLFVNDKGKMDSIVYVELLAQLVAAHSGYESKLEQSKQKTGFLVGIKDFHVYESVSAEDEISMHIQKDYEFDQINYIKGRIYNKEKLIAEGILKLWQKTGDLDITASVEEDAVPERKYLALTKPAAQIIKGMMLNQAIAENIYGLTKSNDLLSAEITLYFPGNFIGFDGHFPGSPVLPGVLMIKTGMLAAELVSERNLRIVEIHQAKFATSIFPNQKVDLKLKLNHQNNTMRINAVIKHKENICSKATIEGQTL